MNELNNNSFYTVEELNLIGFKRIGNNVLISRNAKFYNPQKMIIGNNVRIDDFCILSGSVELGNYIHIAAFCALFGGEFGIKMCDFSGLSSRVSIYAMTDDYLTDCLTNPTVPMEYRNVIGAKVVIEKHVIVGASSIILPGVTLKEGSSFGTLSLINKDSIEWSVNVGIPSKYLKDRQRGALMLEKKLTKEKKQK